MDTITATKVLAQELHKHKHINVLDSSNLPNCIADTKGRVILGDSKYIYTHASEVQTTKKLIKEVKKSSDGANYCFMSWTYGGRSSNYLIASVTNYAIISPLEEKILRETFHKDVPSGITEAMDCLDISNYVNTYQKYMQNEIYEGWSVKGAGQTPFPPHFHEFFEFALSLPAEEQNPKGNLWWLEHVVETAKCGSLMEQLYRNKDASEMFIELFAQISEERQTATVERISTLPKSKQNQGVNMQLFKQGFDVYVRSITLYHKDPEAFMKHFEKQSEDEQRDIITILIPLDNRNVESDEILDQQYHALIEEVGMHFVGDDIK